MAGVPTGSVLLGYDLEERGERASKARLLCKACKGRTRSATVTLVDKVDNLTKQGLLRLLIVRVIPQESLQCLHLLTLSATHVYGSNMESHRHRGSLRYGACSSTLVKVRHSCTKLEVGIYFTI